MSRAFAPVETAMKPAGTARLVQRRCASCGARSGGTCSECGKKKRRPLQARLQVSTPGDAGEREAERAADDVMQGRTPNVRSRPLGSLLQRDTPDNRPPAEQPQPEPAEQPAEASKEGDAPAPAAATNCNPKGLKRADYLKEPGTSVNDFGLTTLSVNAATFPAVVTKKDRGGLKMEPTTAALPTIPSVFTGVDSFVEGEAIFIDQDGTTGCPSGRKLPIRWLIVGSGADKIRDGEQEHCADFQLAFDLSLKRYADAVNGFAASGRRFASQAAAEKTVTRKVGAPPDTWFDVFLCLTRKTLLRDRRDLHKPHPRTHAPRPGGTCEVRAIVDGSSLPQVGTVPSADIIKDCSEAGPVKPAAKKAAKATTGNEVPKPDLSGATWVPSDRDEDDSAPEASLVQRRAEQASSEASMQPADPVDTALAGSGRPLDPDARAFMESRFSRDFSQVRVHTGAAAEASARALGADAYTVGHEVVFGSGRYAPQTPAGRHLIAHELTHVVQQSGAEPISDGRAGVRSGPTAGVSALAVQRQPSPDEIAALEKQLAAKQRERAVLQQELDAASQRSATDVQKRRIATGSKKEEAKLKAGAQGDLQSAVPMDVLRNKIDVARDKTGVTLKLRIQLSYSALREADGRKQAATDIPRIEKTLRDAWSIDLTQGRYAGNRFRLEPSIEFRPNAAKRSDRALQFIVRGAGGDTVADFVRGQVSFNREHLQGDRVIIAAHELYHLFGNIVDAYYIPPKQAKGPAAKHVVGRTDAAGRADLLGMVDPKRLREWRKKGLISQADFDRQTRTQPQVWQEDADVILYALGVAPNSGDKTPAVTDPNSPAFDPKEALDTIRRKGDQRLGEQQRSIDRYKDIADSVEKAERAIQLETEIAALQKRIAELRAAGSPTKGGPP